MTTRRAALKLFSMTPVLGKKMAEKIANDAAIGQLANVAPIPHGVMDQAPSVAQGRDWKAKLKSWLRLKQPLPEWYEESIRREYQWVSSLEPDIACKKSWSMAVKIITQRERNVQRALKRMERDMWLDEKRTEFHERYGIWL